MPGFVTHTRRGNAARSRTRTGPGDGGSLAAATTEEVNAVADLINNQRRRNLAYQSPADLYAALTAH